MAQQGMEPESNPMNTSKQTTSQQVSSSTNDELFARAAPAFQRKQSLLTQGLSQSEDSLSEDEPALHFSRGSSSADFTSDCGAASSPSPPLSPFTFNGVPSLFSKPDFNQTSVAIRGSDDDQLDPRDKPAMESNVEAVLGRKRCITFGCSRKASPTNTPTKAQSPPKVVEPTAPAKRCTIRFAACPNKVSTEKPSEDKKPKIARTASPAPMLLRKREASQSSFRQHRDSDSTVRNESPKASRKNTPVRHHVRNPSTNSDLGHSEATRFHAFASSSEEIDDWTQESTCHKSRLTISDTLRKEIGLRQLGEEVEEEALEDEEGMDEEDEEDVDDDLDDLEEDNIDEYEDSDEGFHTDNEAGFASSDDESDAECDWWTPSAGPTTAATSVEPLDNIRPAGRRSFSDSSVGSQDSNPTFLSQFRSKTSPTKTRHGKRRPMDINVDNAPELPDSTDFVCGTLDEDRPLEEAFMRDLNMKRAAKHRATPQDIDPSFPTSDPELSDNEDEKVVEESDHHPLMHGSLESIHETRGRDKKAPTPKRMRSPPPPLSRRTTAIHRSPPPPSRRPTSSPKRTRSPAPQPSRRPSWLQSPPALRASNLHFVGMGERPQLMVAASLPRTPVCHPFSPLHSMEDEDNNDLPVRGAIDIRAGLEQKRQRRREKLYAKHCKKVQKEGEKKPLPGKGCERMREIGQQIAAYTKSKRVPMPVVQSKDPLMLSI